MTTATGENERTVTVTVKEAAKQAKRADHPADYKLTVDSQWFQSQKPTVIYVPLDVGAGIEPNDSLTMVIRPKGLKGHGDTPYDGQKPWMYHWEFVRLAGTGNGAAPAAPPSGVAGVLAKFTDAERKAAALAPDPRGNSIERQVALIQANLLAINGVLVPEEGKGLLDTIEGAANSFIAWLQGTTAPDTDRTQGAGEPEPDIDETQAPTNVDDLPF